MPLGLKKRSRDSCAQRYLSPQGVVASWKERYRVEEGCHLGLSIRASR